MNPPTLNAETEALIQGYLEGTLTPDEAARLLAALKVEPVLVGTILDGLRTDALIRRVVAKAGVIPVSEQSSAAVPAAAASVMPSAAPTRNSAPILSFPLVTSGEKARRWQLSLALAASLALLAGLAVWFFGPTMGQPLLAEVQGSDVSLERGTEFIPATTGIHLQAIDVLRTATNATAMITFGPEKTRLALRPGSELKLVSLACGKRFDLRSGTIEAAVARQRPLQPMILVTAQAEARVLGTKFTLMTTTNATHLDVSEGKVRLTRTADGARVDVPKGRYAIAATGVKLAALPQSGSILREYWTNLPGSAVNDLLDHPDYPDRPNGRDYVDLLEVPAVGATNYGCRLVGYLHPPVTGKYIFWIAASPSAAVNLSRDENPANAVRIFGDDFDFGRGRESQPRKWERKAETSRTQSQPITLVAGRRYYIEAVHKADDRVGHLAIAWTPPGGERELIAGRYLSPLKTKKSEKRRWP